MKKTLLFCFLTISLFASDVKNIDDIEEVNFNIKTTEITQIFKDMAKDLVEIKKKQFNILKRLDDVQEKSYHNEQKLKIVELIIDEQKSIIKDLIVELNSIRVQNVSANIEDEIKEESPKEIEKKEVSKNVKKITKFKATTFELTVNSEFFNYPNDKVIDDWKSGRKFTAYEKIGSWIKVSGYFVRGKWQKSKLELWIDSKKYPLKKIKR